MEHNLNWLNEEEGTITCSERNGTVFTAQFYVTGEEEAEFRLQDVVLPEKQEKSNNMREEIIAEMTNFASECFRLLWEEGFEEVLLVEQKGTEVAKILNSTNVVQKIYSELMMKRHFEMQKSTDCGVVTINLTKEENGYFCESKDGAFTCRLLSYETEQPEGACFYLYEVEVSKEKRNKGIATSCLTELFRKLSKEMPVTIYLQVGSYNEPAVHLYEKLGFEISEELCYYAAEE